MVKALLVLYSTFSVSGRLSADEHFKKSRNHQKWGGNIQNVLMNLDIIKKCKQGRGDCIGEPYDSTLTCAPFHLLPNFFLDPSVSRQMM